MREETGAEITRELEEVSGAGDYLVHELSELTDRWKCQGKGFDSVEAILRFMESNPDLDYGVPGPLVQFAESFYAQGREFEYKQKLIESLNRAPMYYTVWMLNRLINGEHNSVEKRRLVAEMERIAGNTALKSSVRTLAGDFLEWQATHAPVQ
jgi:hypothetical protein